MCRLAWFFAARICDKYLNHMNWYKQFGLSLHLHPFFLVQSAKALARLCECAGSPGFFAARICDKYLNHMDWYKQFGMTLNLYPFLLVQSVKSLARLCECKGSPDVSLLAYAIST